MLGRRVLTPSVAHPETGTVTTMRISLLALPGLLLLVGLGGWWWFHPALPLPTTEEPMLLHDGDLIHVRANSPLQHRLHADIVKNLTLPHYIDLPARFVAPDEQNFPIRSPIAGRVAALYVEEGQKVRKDTVLATIYSGDMAQAMADNDKAQSALIMARSAWQRANAVLAAGGNAVKDQQSARNDLEQAEAEVRRAQGHLQALESGQDSTRTGLLTITAPHSGIVTSVSVGVGQMIVDATTTLMTLIDTQMLRLQASVPENILPMLGPDMVLQTEFNNQLCSGPVTYRDPNIHIETHRLDLYLRCDNTKGQFYPGLFVTATLAIPQTQQLILPKTALLMDNDKVSVFVETAPNSYKRRYVSISYDEGDNVRVFSGIKAGEHVVTSGAILLNDY